MPQPRRLWWVIAVIAVIVLIVGGRSLYHYYEESALIGKLDDYDTRLEAAEELASIASIRGIPEFLRWIGDRDGLELVSLRLGSMDLISMKRDRMAVLLNRIVDDRTGPAVEMFVGLLQHEDSVIRRGAARWLRGSAYWACPYVTTIRSRLAVEADACTRVLLARLLWELGLEGDSVARSLIEGPLPKEDCSDELGKLVSQLPSSSKQLLRRFGPTLVRRVIEKASEGLESLSEEDMLWQLQDVCLTDVGLLLDDPSPVVRSRGVRLLVDIGPPARRFIPRLLELWGDPDEEVRLECIRAIGAMGTIEEFGTRGIELLMDRVERGGTEERAAALSALGEIGHGADKAMRTVARAAKDDDPTVQREAIWTLYRLTGNEEASVATFLQGVRSSNDSVATVSAKVLYHCGTKGPTICQTLKRILDEAPKYPTLYSSKEVWVTASLVSCDCGINRRDAIAVFLAVLANGVSPDAIDASLEVLLLFDVRDACRDLVRLCLDPYRRNSRRCAMALRKLQPDRKDLHPLIEALERREDDAYRAFRAYTVLWDLGVAGAPVVPDLIELLNHESVVVRSMAADSLGFVGSRADSAALEALEALVRRDVRRVRYYALRGLEGILGRDELQKKVCPGL